MSRFFSEKLRIVSFLSIIIVFYMHTGFPDSVKENMMLPVLLRGCIVGVLGRCAVPMFFAISGYLFFYNVKNGLKDVLAKMKKRVKTLFVPFVIAALFFPAFFVIMKLIPGASSYVNSDSYMDKVMTMPVKDVLTALFYDCGNGAPWAYHLWFLRDLIIIVAITPLIYYFRKWMGGWSAMVIFVLYLLFPDLSILYSLFWFVSGGCMLDKLDKFPKWCYIAFFVLFLILSAYQQIVGFKIWLNIKIIVVSLGLVSLWGGYDILVSKEFELKKAPLLNFACQFTFFLYLYHEPAIHIIVKGFPLALGSNAFGYTMSFLLSPLVFLPVGISIGYLLRKHTPSFYKVIVGGR